MREDGVDLGRARLHEFVNGAADGAARVCHVVHKDGDAVLDIADQRHARHLVGLLPLFVDQRELHIQPKMIHVIFIVFLGYCGAVGIRGNCHNNQPVILQYKIVILDLCGCQKAVTISVVKITEKDCTIRRRLQQHACLRWP